MKRAACPRQQPRGTSLRGWLSPFQSSCTSHDYARAHAGHILWFRKESRTPQPEKAPCIAPVLAKVRNKGRLAAQEHCVHEINTSRMSFLYFVSLECMYHSKISDSRYGSSCHFPFGIRIHSRSPHNPYPAALFKLIRVYIIFREVPNVLRSS